MSYQTANQMAEDVKRLIDNYWRLELSENAFSATLLDIFSNSGSRGLAIRGLQFKAGFERKVGKKRLMEIKRVLVKVNRELFQYLQ